MSVVKLNRAFTLIELLVVILVIGILIAIAAPSFLNQQNKAKDSASKQSLSTAYKIGKAEYTSNGQSSFPAQAALVASLQQSEPSQNFVAGTNFAAGQTQVSVDSIQQVGYRAQSAAGTQVLLTDNEATGKVTRLTSPSGQPFITGTNLLTNPSFETGLASWGQNGTGTITTYQNQSGWASAGTSSLRLTGSATAGQYIYSTTATLAGSITAGLRYYAAADFNLLNLTTGGCAYLQVNWYDAGGGFLRQDFTGADDYSLGVTRISGSWIPPATSVSARMFLVLKACGGVPANLDAYFDSVQLVQASSANNYFDGDSAGGTWTGIPHASTSLGYINSTSW